MIDMFKDRWHNLNRREQRLVAFGTVTLLAIGYYSAILKPLLNEKAQLVNRVQVEKALYDDTRQHVKRIARLGLAEKQVTTDMQTFIKQTTEANNITSIDLQSPANNVWQLRFESVDTTSFVAWLEKLNQAGVNILQFSLIKTEGLPTVTVENLQVQKNL